MTQPTNPATSDRGYPDELVPDVPAWLDIDAVIPRGLMDEMLRLQVELLEIEPRLRELGQRFYRLNAQVDAALTAADPDGEAWDVLSNATGRTRLFDTMCDVTAHLSVTDCVTTPDWLTTFKESAAV